MKKPYGFNVLSNRICSTKGCSVRIKQNVVERKGEHGMPSARLVCFDCYRKAEKKRGHVINR